MRGLNSYKRFAGVGVALALLVGVGVAIVQFTGRSQRRSTPAQPVRTGDAREVKSITPDLVTAIRNADARAVGKLLDGDEDVNARDAEGNTPLILASLYASPECVELLIKNGADVNAANKAGATALIRAAPSPEKTSLLVAAGANVRVRTADLGNTPLILAARRADNSRTVRLLLAHGADGTWHVVRRAFPFQPTMDSSFPHHRDSWISAAATSWAVMALTRALPVGPAPGEPAAARPMPPVPLSESARKVDFARQVKPLLERSCVGCHSGERPRSLFRVNSRAALLRGGASGAAAVVPGQSEKSPLIDYVSGKVPESEMPPKAVRERFPALTADEVGLLRTWIDQGAEWPAGVLPTSPKIEKQR
jgi:hypothetical protein